MEFDQLVIDIFYAVTIQVLIVCLKRGIVWVVAVVWLAMEELAVDEVVMVMWYGNWF